MKYIESLSGIVKEHGYKTVAIDVYGVLHDGATPYPYSRQCLEELTRSGVRTILLSNSTRLGHVLAADLERKFGFARSSYSEILSSGDLTRLFLHRALKDDDSGTSCVATVSPQGMTMTPEEFQSRYIKTRRFFLVGKDDYHGPLFESLAVERVADWQETMDFVLLGMIVRVVHDKPLDVFDESSVRQHYQSFLQHCLERRIPFVCANPDVWAPNGHHEDGAIRLLACPGYIGKMYEEMGGQVLYFGKPFASIYEYLINNKVVVAGEEDKQQRVLCVGDNMATDVLGARKAGLDVAMVLGGVHSREVDMNQPAVAVEQVETLAQEHHSPEPTFIIPLLRY